MLRIGSYSWLLLSVWLAGVQLPMGTGNIHGPGKGRADLGQCAGPRVRQGSPESVLPRPTPLSATSLPPVMQAYQAGLQQCKENYQRLKSEFESKSQFPKANPGQALVRDRTTNSEWTKCKGNAAFFAATGLVLWPFGPERCEVGSECWTGVLACGEPREDIRQQAQWDGAESSYRGWSLGSVHIHTVVQGRHGEVVAPDMQLSTGPAANGGQPVEFILWRFVLTTTGPFDVEMRLEGWYPGRLHRPLESNQTSSRDLSNFQYFGAISHRCPSGRPCNILFYLPQCEKWSYLPQTPRKLQSVDTGVCPPRTEELPVCRGGDNDGRYLILPPIARNLCKLDEYFERLTKIAGNLKGKALEERIAPTLVAYSVMVNGLDSKALWEEILQEDQWTSLDAETRRYLKVLKRYAHGNPCMLADVRHLAISKQKYNFDLALYSPYECRYHLYNAEESKSCASANGVNNIVFHGDSMSRDLFAMALNQFSVSQISIEQLKEDIVTSKANHKAFSNSGIHLSELYYWFWDVDLIKKTEAVVPDVYVTNYALAHMCSDAIEKFEKQVDKLLVSYWATREAAHPRLKIFQSAKDNHGRRLEYFIGERFRQSNAVLRRALVGKFGFQELDEWLLTAPMLERGGDGWHFAGTVRRMESLILVNMICNQ